MNTSDEVRAAFDAWLKRHFSAFVLGCMTAPEKSLALQAYQAGHSSAQKWRPISEAPVDGTEVWAFNGEQGRMKFSKGTEWALWIWADEVLADVDPCAEQPTHFRDLPEPP